MSPESQGKSSPMKRSRREFLKAGAMAAVATGIPLAMVNAAPGWSQQPRRIGWPASRSGREDVYSLATFAPHVESSFNVRTGINRVQLTLVEAADLNPATTGSSACGQGECFALRFAVPLHHQFPQGIHSIEHPALGQFPLFLAPVGRPTLFVIYEAVINRTQGCSAVISSPNG